MAGVEAELDLDIAKFRTALGNAEKHLNGFASRAAKTGGGSFGANFAGSITSGFTSAAGAITSAATTMLTGALVVAAGAAAFAAVKGIKAAMSEETLAISFEVLTGDVEKGKRLMDEIREYGTATPYEFPGLAEAARLMLNFGISVEDIMPNLKTLGDIASGDENKLNSLALAFSQASSAGRLMGQDLLQMINAGFNPLNEIAKRTGESMAELKKRMEAGLVPFSEVEEAFKAATSEGGLFFDMANRQSRTTAGLFSTLSDSFNEVLKEFGKPINDAIRPLLAGAILLVEDFKAGAQAAAEGLVRAFRVVVATWQELSGGDMLSLVGDALSLGFKTAVNVLWAGLKGAFAAAGVMMVENIKLALSLLRIATTYDFWAGMGNSLLGMARKFGALMLEFIAGALDSLKEIPGMSSIIGDSPDLIRDVANEADRMGNDNLNDAKDRLTPAFDAVTDQLRDAAARAGQSFSDAFSATPDAISTEGEAERISDAMTRIADRVSKNQQEASAAATPASDSTKPSTGNDATKPALATEGKRSGVIGGLAGAINTILGKSANELIAIEATKQNKTLESVDKTLKVIANQGKAKVQPAKNSTPTPVAVFS